jgi:hypothetical protein
MKYSNTIITLLVILFAALLLGTFLGVKSREGITYNKLTVLEDILTRKGENKDKMEIIKTLNIEDEDFQKAINRKVDDNGKEIGDDYRISEIKSLVANLFKTDISKNTYSDALLIDINQP